MIPLKLSYGDVLLVPKKAIVSSRKEISTKTRLAKNLLLNIPVISSNMDSVTESDMAIAMARLGGIGFIHRFMSNIEQAEEIKKVKRADNIIIEFPYTISLTDKVSDMRKLMQEKSVDGFLVIDEKEILQGIVTKRDIMFKDNDDNIENVMTTYDKLTTGWEGMSIDEAKELFIKSKVKKLPLIDNDRKIKGLITLKDIKKREMYPNAARDNNGRLLVGASIGIKDDFFEQAEMFVNAGADVLVIDVAHGHAIRVFEVLKKVKENFDIPIIVGNVATPQAVEELIIAGADGIKVGVGPGATCSTRIVAGAGVPQFSAVLECSEVAHRYNVPIIADGGIKTSGDIVKAIAAGASTVMLGTTLAGCSESPGLVTIRKGEKYKVVRGMASFGAAMGRTIRMKKKVGKDLEEVVPEGVESIVRYKGSVVEFMAQMIGGLRSGISYCGAKDIQGMWKNAKFCQVTSAGIKESVPHVLK